MKAILLLLLFYCSNVSAYTLMLKWYPPSERENGDPLTIDEISHFSMYPVDCDSLVVDYDNPKYEQLYHKQGIMFWHSINPVDCVVMHAIDTDGRKSLPSALFKAVEYNAPRPAECRQ